MKKNERERDSEREKLPVALVIFSPPSLSSLLSQKGGGRAGGANSKIFEIFSLEEKRTREKNKKQVKIHPIGTMWTRPRRPPPKKKRIFKRRIVKWNKRDDDDDDDDDDIARSGSTGSPNVFFCRVWKWSSR